MAGFRAAPRISRFAGHGHFSDHVAARLLQD
jgi:hypothetical protein